jgi:hypothetical protein
VVAFLAKSDYPVPGYGGIGIFVKLFRQHINSTGISEILFKLHAGSFMSASASDHQGHDSNSYAKRSRKSTHNKPDKFRERAILLWS